MSDTPSGAPRSSLPEPAGINGVSSASADSIAVSLHGDGPAFGLPARLFEQVPFAIYICDRQGLLLRYNRRAAELWGRSPALGDPNERFCGSHRIYRADGRLLAHDECPMADVLRTGISVHQREVQIERPDGSRGIALVDIEAVTDTEGNIVGAINCFQDITERKRAEEREKMFARELDHRARNLLALVQAAVQLTHADTVKDFKAAVEGRLRALSNAHSLLAQSRWMGADLHSLITEELAAYRAAGPSRVDISGPTLALNPQSAQSVAIVLHELATNAVKYGALSIPSGRLRVEWSREGADIVIRWSETDGPPVKEPRRQGFGTRLLGPVVQSGLAGKLRFDWNPAGLACEVIIPLAHVTDALG